MKAFEFFKLAVHGWRRREPEARPSPYGIPGVYEDDARFILAASGREKWLDVQHVGPGAKDAAARRAERLAAKTTPEIPAKKKRPRLSKAERLKARIEKLKAEIEALK